MIRTLFFILMLGLLSFSIPAQSLKRIFNKKFKNLQTNTQLNHLQDSFNIKLNTLNKCLKWGNWANDQNLKAINFRLKDFAQRLYKEGNGIVLTWGTNGNCGRKGAWFDELTLPYGFTYASVNCSCIVGNIDKMVNAFNEVTFKLVKRKYGGKWKKNLEKAFLKKKRTITINLSPKKALKVKEYRVYNRSLQKYPKVIEKLENLEALTLGNNQISTLPKSICGFKSLKLLDLGKNHFRYFPKEILCFENLQELDLSDNYLKKLPDDISKLNKLQRLNLSGNRLKTLPDDTGKLNKLQELNIAHNKLKQLPRELSGMINLRWLDIRENFLNNLPQSLSKIINLKTLILWDNNFKEIPPVLYKMQYLKTLFIKHGNQINEAKLEKLRKALPHTEIK